MNVKNKKRVYPLIFLSVLASNSFAISKCQDANGKWHYGARANSKCVESEITKLNDRGVVKDKVVAPKTPEELKAARAKVQEEEKIRLIEKAELEQKNRILKIYEKEEDIERVRQNNVRSINQQIGLTNNYIKSLREKRESKLNEMNTVNSQTLKDDIKQQIADIDAEIKQSSQSSLKLEEKLKTVNARYDKELSLFRKYN